MNVMIVDDEKHACDRLAELVAEIPGYYVKACSQDGLDAVKKVDTMDIDVVLMDIHMPVMDGLEAAKHMNRSAKSPQIIFTTAYRQHAFSAFGVNAKGFLLKPIMRRQLKEKLAQLQKPRTAKRVQEASPSAHRSRIYCRVANQHDLIAIKDIIYFKSEQKYTMIKHTHGMHLIDETLKQIEQEFGDILIRVHRNTLVNKSYMQYMKQDDRKRTWLGLKCISDKLYVSRNYITQVRGYLKQFSISQIGNVSRKRRLRRG